MISKVPASSPELNLIGVLRLFGVDRATDQTLQASTVAQLNREALLSLCAVLEVGFQARLLSDIPGGLGADFMEALDQEFGDKRRGLLVGMFVNRLHGDAYELNVEENVGFADYASFVAFARDLYDARKIRRLRNALRENAPEELARVLMVSKWLWPWHRLPVYSLLARVNERIARRLDGNREIMELRESISEIANYIYDFYPMLVVESEDRYFQSMLWHYVALM